MRRQDLAELGVVSIAAPCSADWNAMRGEGVKRFCAQCKLNVYDFSKLTTNEARVLLVQTDGRLCGRIFVRKDGTVLTKDCPTGLARARRQVFGALGVAAAFGLSILTAALQAAGAPKNVVERVQRSVAKVASVPTLHWAPITTSHPYTGVALAGGLGAPTQKNTKKP